MLCKESLFVLWEQKIGFQTDHMGSCPDLLQGLQHASAPSSHMMGVHTLREPVITECVKPAGQLFSLVYLVGFTSIGSQGVDVRIILIQIISLGMPVGKQGQAARHFHSFYTRLSMTLQPCWIEFDAEPLTGVECFSPGRMKGVGGNGHDMLKQVWF